MRIGRRATISQRLKAKRSADFDSFVFEEYHFKMSGDEWDALEENIHQHIQSGLQIRDNSTSEGPFVQVTICVRKLIFKYCF